MQAQQPYSREIEAEMQQYYESLSEKDRRRYAAIEAKKLGYGGQAYIRRLFGCHHETLKQGMREIESGEDLTSERIRRQGGGRKRLIERIVGLDEAFLGVIEQHTAGSPMDERVKWTNLTRQQIADLLSAAGYSVSVTVVDQLLEKHDYRKRQALKMIAGGSHAERNQQFENIETLKQDYRTQGNPVMSMDTKKKS
jgi:Rhodopirellula transposase DDE domain